MKGYLLTCLVSALMIATGWAQTDQLNVIWDPNTEPNIEQYKLQRAINSTTDFSDLATINHPATSLVDGDIQPGNLYSYRVQAINSDGLGSGFTPVVSVGLPFITLELSTIQTGKDTTFDMSSHIVDPDDGIFDFDFEISGQNNLVVSGQSGFITITPSPIDYVGPASFTLRIIDPDGMDDLKTIDFDYIEGGSNLEFIVIVPNVVFNEDASFDIFMDSCVTISNYDPDELQWAFSGDNNISWNYNSASRIVSLSSANPNWNGTVTLNATATAPDNSTRSDNFLVTLEPLNDPPVASISQLFISSDPEQNDIELDGYVVDVDDSDSELDWEFLDFSNFTFMWVDVANHIVRITPENGVTSESGTFRVSDPDGAFDEVTVTIQVLEDSDEFFIVEVADQRFNEDGFTTIFMDTCVNISNYNPSDLSWSFANSAEVVYNYSPLTRIVTIQTGIADWFGQNSIYATATAPDQSTAADTFFVDVLPVNDPPNVSVSTLFVQDDPDSNLIDLNDYVVDVDNSGSDLSWTFWGFTSMNIEWENQGAGLIRITPENSVQDETGFFGVSDPFGASDTAEVMIFVLQSGEEVFEVEIADASFDEDTQFSVQMDTTLTISNYLPREISWNFLTGDNLEFTWNPLTRKVTLQSADPNWFGEDQLIAIALAPDQSTRVDTARVTIRPVNDAPFISLEELFVSPFSQNLYDLDLYVTDEDDSPQDLDWQFWGFNNFTISWYNQANNIIQITANGNPDEENAFFRAEDASGAADTSEVVIYYIEENTAPAVELPYVIALSEDSVATFNLVRFVIDSTHTITELDIDVSTGSNISANLNLENYVLTITPDPDWSGESSIAITATDPLGLVDEQEIVVIVQERNDLQALTLSNGAENDEVLFQITTQLPSTIDLSYWLDVFQILTISRTTYQTSHSITLSNLDVNATYFYSLRVTDEFGKTLSVVDSSFRVGELTPEVTGDFLVYPNPVKPSSGHQEMIFMHMPAETRQIAFFSILGEKVYEQEVASYSGDLYRLSVQDNQLSLPSGLYIYMLRDSGSKVLKKGKIAIIR